MQEELTLKVFTACPSGISQVSSHHYSFGILICREDAPGRNVRSVRLSAIQWRIGADSVRPGVHNLLVRGEPLCCHRTARAGVPVESCWSCASQRAFFPEVQFDGGAERDGFCQCHGE